jgi:hypothetical protein
MAPPKMVYQLKISIDGIKPLIWRRILIPTSATFWDLHCAIQDVFHWKHLHPHHYYCKDSISNEVITFGMPSRYDTVMRITTIPSWEHKISKYLNCEEPRLKYVYDISNLWFHTIELENILPAEKDVTYPICISGRQNSPPENCRGAYGYMNLLEILSYPTDKEYDDTKEWIESMKGGPFDPKHFDTKEVTFMDTKQRYKYRSIA